MDISKELRYRREAEGLTQTELARQAHVSKAYLWQLENEKGKAVSAAILHRIAKVLGTRVESFFYCATYCQRCGRNFQVSDKHHSIKDGRHMITYIIGHVCKKCAKEYRSMRERHDKEVCDWVNERRTGEIRELAE